MRQSLVLGCVFASAHVALAMPIDAGARDASVADSATGHDGALRDGVAGDRALTATLPKWAPSLRASVSPAEVSIGDPITATIVLTYRQGVSASLPLQLSLEPFVELSRDESSKTLGPEGHLTTIEHTFTLRVASYELGEQTLPPIEVNAVGAAGELVTVATDPLPIAVTSVMPNEPDPQLRGLAPPVRVFRRSWWLLYLALALVAAGLVVLITLLVHRRIQARRAARPGPPPPPAHAIALRRLDELPVAALLAQARVKELYLQLSEIMREYIGARWGFDALEMTTTEIDDAMQEIASRQRGQRETCGVEAQLRVRTYLDACDLVKFAKFKPAQADAHDAVAEARAIVVAMIPAARAQSTTQTSAGSSGGQGGPSVQREEALVGTDSAVSATREQALGRSSTDASRSSETAE